MRKHWWSLILLSFSLALLCSCGSKDQGEPDFSYIPKADEYYDGEEASNISEEDQQPIENRWVDSFSSGRAWISYVYEGEQARYLGCIDESGNLLFSFDSDEIKDDMEPFENGVSYVRDMQGVIYLINDDGDVLTSSKDAQFDGIIAYGDGYFLTYKHIENFDLNEYILSIIDDTGEVIKEIRSDDYGLVSWERFEELNANLFDYCKPAGYCGEGIFQFMKSDTDVPGRPYLFYDITEDSFFEITCSSYSLTEIEDGMCILRIDGEDVLYDITTQTDNSEQIKAWKASLAKFKDETYSYGPISNGRVVYIAYSSYDSHWEDPIYSCMYADKTGVYPIEAYSEYLSAAESRNMVFDQDADRLLLRFVGKDGNHYRAIIDGQGNTIMEPKKCDPHDSSYNFSCGRFVITTEDGTYVCDTDGNVIFSLDDVGGSSISDFSDGVAWIDKSEASKKAVDVDGNILFDGINTANNQLLTLSFS